MPIFPGPLSEVGHRRFMFYPAIVGVEHNEWTLLRAGWTEARVVNAKTGIELCIPSRFLGEVASSGDPVVIVGLIKELEVKEGILVPHRRRVIEMPRVVNGAPHLTRSAQPAPVVAIRTEQEDAGSRARRLLRGGVAAGILVCVGAGLLVRDTSLGNRVLWPRSASRPTRLTSQDDYEAIVQKLGRPDSDQWLATRSGASYRRLNYARRGFVLILTGSDPYSARYAGALGPRGTVIHAATPAVLQEISGAETGK